MSNAIDLRTVHGGAHIVKNEGTSDLVLIAFQVLPLGAPRRIDEPAP